MIDVKKILQRLRVGFYSSTERSVFEQTMHDTLSAVAAERDAAEAGMVIVHDFLGSINDADGRGTPTELAERLVNLCSEFCNEADGAADFECERDAAIAALAQAVEVAKKSVNRLESLVEEAHTARLATQEAHLLEELIAARKAIAAAKAVLGPEEEST